MIKKKKEKEEKRNLIRVLKDKKKNLKDRITIIKRFSNFKKKKKNLNNPTIRKLYILINVRVFHRDLSHSPSEIDISLNRGSNE